jgi:hypothetical protein
MMLSALASSCGCLSTGSSVVQRVRDAFSNGVFVKEDDAPSEAQQVLRHYRESVIASEDDQMAVLRTFRAPGRIIFLRPHLTCEHQPYAYLITYLLHAFMSASKVHTLIYR